MHFVIRSYTIHVAGRDVTLYAWQWAVLICSMYDFGVTRANRDTAAKLTENALTTLSDGVVTPTPDGEEAVRELQRKGIKFDIPSPPPERPEEWLATEYHRLTQEIHTAIMKAIESHTIFADEEQLSQRWQEVDQRFHMETGD